MGLLFVHSSTIFRYVSFLPVDKNSCNNQAIALYTTTKKLNATGVFVSTLMLTTVILDIVAVVTTDVIAKKYKNTTFQTE
jgi:hypothetical protein